MKMRTKALSVGLAAIVITGGLSTAAMAGTTFSGTASETVAIGAQITVQNAVALQSGSHGCNITTVTVTNTPLNTVTFAIASDKQTATVDAAVTTQSDVINVDVVCVDGPKTYTTHWTVNVLPAGSVSVDALSSYYMLVDAQTPALTATVGPDGNTATATWSIDTSGNTAGCTIANGNQVAYTSVGSCTVIATIADSASYTGATASATVNVKDTPTVTVTGISNPYMAATGTVTIGATNTGDSTSYTYAVASAGDTLCTVDSASGVVTFSHEGTCSVTATAAATADYVAATSAATDIVVHNTRTLSLSDASYQLHQGVSGVTVVATPSVGTGDITYTLGAAGSANCSVTTGGLVTWTAVGTCTIDADIAASGLYEEATTSATITVGPNTTEYVVTVTGYAPKGGKALAIRRANAVAAFLVAQGLTDVANVTVTYVVTGKTVAGATLNTRKVNVSVTWTGNTSGSESATVYFNRGISSLSGKARWVKNAQRTLHGVYLGTDLA